MRLPFKIPEGANLFDVCLNVYTSLDLLPKFMKDNGIASYNKVFSGKEEVIFDTDFISDEFVYSIINKTDLLFVTSKNKSVRYLLSENGSYILQENNFKIIV